HALLQAVLVAHQHLLAPVLREHGHFHVRVVHRDRAPEEVLEGEREAFDERANHAQNDTISPEDPAVLQEPKFLSAGQFLLTTLIVKLAVMAALATMLARYRRFRHILIFEQRNWPDR